MSRNNSPPTNSIVRNRFVSHSRSPNRPNGFKKYSKSRSISRSPLRNRLLRRSPMSRSPRRSLYSRSPRRSISRSPRRSSPRRSPRRPPRRINRSYSRSASRDYRRKPRRSYSRSRSPPRIRRKVHGDREHPTPSSCIGVFGLSKRTEERQLWDIFERYGHIKSIQLVMDKYTRMSQGFGFIYYDDIESATKAKVEGNGMDIDGKIVRIDYSITRKAHTPTPGVYLGKKSSRRRGKYDERDYDDRDRRDSYGRREYSDRRRPRSRTRSPYRRSSSRSYGSYPKRDR